MACCKRKLRRVNDLDQRYCCSLYNSIADQVNDSFPGFMEQAFHVPREMGSNSRRSRDCGQQRPVHYQEAVCSKCIDKENKRVDTHGEPGKVKAMGLDLKRSDTPKVIQDFLSEILDRSTYR
jgi:hypothetical protein